jgi:hypothetical protein
VRPPQPPVYFFLIDVSEPALVSGMLHSMTRAIKASLDELPGGNRAQVGELLAAVVLTPVLPCYWLSRWFVFVCP